MKVLIVDDELALAEALRDALIEDGFEVRVAHHAEAGLALVRSWAPDVVLFDIMMPGRMSGLDALRTLRRESDVPALLMSGRGGDADKVLGLEYADDYLVKPFSSAELAARIRAVMRRAASRSTSRAPQVLQVGDLYLNLATCEVAMAGRDLALTPMQIRILSVLANQPGRVFSREELMTRVWGEEKYVDPHCLDVHVRGLRSKLEKDPSRPQHLVTVRGLGFRYVP